MPFFGDRRPLAGLKCMVYDKEHPEKLQFIFVKQA
jgi:hypothetical protein